MPAADEVLEQAFGIEFIAATRLHIDRPEDM